MNDIRALTQHEIDSVSGGPGPFLIIAGLAILGLGLTGCQINVTTCDGGNCTQSGGEQNNDVDGGEGGGEGGEGSEGSEGSGS